MVRAQPTALATEPNAPPWFQRFVNRLPDFFAARQPTGPVATFVCLSTEAPSAAQNLYAVALFRDIPTLAISNGTTWVRADGSTI